jgi:type IV pilus assembly protein PilB
MNVLDVLVKRRLISPADVPAIEKEAALAGGDLRVALEARGVAASAVRAAEQEVASAIPSRAVDPKSIPFDVLKHIPEESAKYYKFVPIGVADGILEIGIVNPENIEALDALSFIASKNEMPYKLFLITEDDFDRVIEVYRGLTGEVNKALTDLESELSVDDEAADAPRAEELTKEEKKMVGGVITEDAPVTKIVATILRYAIEGGASDIHIEHTGVSIRVRFRVDGDLQTSLVLPVSVHKAVVARIKILCDMKIDEHRKPQDGRFSARIEGRQVDFRVSTFPAYYGEKVVMRILDKEKGAHKLTSLGLRDEDLKKVRDAIAKPYGIILISGPTGSGKSTTLYAMLDEVDREHQNVLSLEDPVEFNIDGVSQAQVRPEIGFSFADGLRTTLRQDPDIIMVGEIRDKETAQLAIQAALTGHLVLSTIHTNNAVGVVSRLVNMGVDPFLIGPTLVLSMAQRLVRKICPGAEKPIPIEGSYKAWVEKSFSDLSPEAQKLAPKGNFYKAEPIAECANGTRGRLAVFEMFSMDKKIEEAVLKDPTDMTLLKLARAQGMLTMEEDAMIKCSQKLVPLEEISTLSSSILTDDEAI